MKLEINRHSEMSISAQIEQAIEDKIESGFLKTGEKLPSIRTLTESLGVSFLTVVKVYDKLESKGVIEKRHGQGCFVAEQQTSDSELYIIPKKWQSKANNYITRAQLHRHMNENKGKFKYDFSLSVLRDYIFPNQLFDELTMSQHKMNDKMMSQYPPVQGDLRLRNVLTQYFLKHHLNLKNENLLIVNGVQQAINLVARTLVGKGDTVYIEETSFPAAIDVFRWEGAMLKPIPMQSDGLDINYLHKLCDEKPPELVYVVPNFNNPQSILMSDEKKRKLIELAQTYDFLIVEDDTWSDLYFTDYKPISLKSLDTMGHVIYLKGFSKLIGAGFRIGAIAASEQIITLLTAAKSISDLGSPYLTQIAVRGILESQAFENEIMMRRKLLVDKYKIIVNALNKYGKNKITYVKPQGGLCLWLTLPKHINTNELLIEARRHEVTYLPGQIFYSSNYEKNHLRLSYCHLEDEDIVEGIKRLCELI